MDTKKLTRLIDVLTEAGLSIREAQALIEEGCRKIPDMEKKMKEELCKPSILRKTVVSPREKDQEGYLILDTIRIPSLHSLKSCGIEIRTLFTAAHR